MRWFVRVGLIFSLIVQVSASYAAGENVRGFLKARDPLMDVREGRTGRLDSIKKALVISCALMVGGCSTVTQAPAASGTHPLNIAEAGKIYETWKSSASFPIPDDYGLVPIISRLVELDPSLQVRRKQSPVGSYKDASSNLSLNENAPDLIFQLDQNLVAGSLFRFRFSTTTKGHPDLMVGILSGNPLTAFDFQRKLAGVNLSQPVRFADLVNAWTLECAYLVRLANTEGWYAGADQRRFRARIAVNTLGELLDSAALALKEFEPRVSALSNEVTLLGQNQQVYEDVILPAFYRL